MNADRRILTPVAATLFGAVLVGAATLGGTLSEGSAVTAKSDRFATIGDSLCADQAWPNLTPECLAWVEGTPLTDVRFITMAARDGDAQKATLTRTAVESSDEF